MILNLKNKLHGLRGLSTIFYITVCIPTILSIIYYGFLASDVYVSQSRFVIRSPDKPQTTGFGFLLKSVGFSSSGDEVYAARDYLTSRDALRELNRGNAVANSYGSNDISLVDRFDPFNIEGTFESLYKYAAKKIGVQFDSSTSITTLTVKAYNSKDAQAFNQQLLRQAESLVNRLNERAKYDLIRVTQKEVEQAKADAQAASVALSRYRNRFHIVDPDRQATVQLQLISKLQDQLVASRIELAQLRELAPQSSSIPPVETRIGNLEQMIKDELLKVAGGQKSLSSAVVEYEKLQLENQFADKRVTAALASLEEAKSAAQRQQAYVERIVEPNLPDYPLEPYRMRGVFATFVMGLIAWGVLSLLFSSLKEHVE